MGTVFCKMPAYLPIGKKLFETLCSVRDKTIRVFKKRREIVHLPLDESDDECADSIFV